MWRRSVPSWFYAFIPHRLDSGYSVPWHSGDTSETDMDVLPIGELRLDKISTGSGHRECFRGAPANVAVNCAQLRGKAAVIAKVGADSTGLFLLEMLNARGVVAGGVVIDPKHRISEVHIGLGEIPCRAVRDADARLQPYEVSTDLVSRCGSQISLGSPMSDGQGKFVAK